MNDVPASVVAAMALLIAAVAAAGTWTGLRKLGASPACVTSRPLIALIAAAVAGATLLFLSIINPSGRAVSVVMLILGGTIFAVAARRR